MLHFRCSMNWKQPKHQQLSQLLCQMQRFLMQLIVMHSFPCRRQSEPPARPGIFTFCIFACYIRFRWFKEHFAKCQFIPSSKPTLQTNEGHKAPSEGLPEWHQLPVFTCQTHPWAAGSAQAGQSAAPAPALESFGNKTGNQTKPRLSAPLEAGPQMFLKQEHLAVSWRALDVFSPKASFITSCCFISCLLSWTAFYYCNSIVRD